jgi:hypothetical protein
VFLKKFRARSCDEATELDLAPGIGKKWPRMWSSGRLPRWPRETRDAAVASLPERAAELVAVVCELAYEVCTVLYTKQIIQCESKSN